MIDHVTNINDKNNCLTSIGGGRIVYFTEYWVSLCGYRVVFDAAIY